MAWDEVLRFPWDRSVRVPLMIRGPGFMPGLVRTDLTANVDVKPGDVLVIPPDTAADTAAAELAGVDLRHSVAALHAILTPGTHLLTPCLTLVS